MDRKTKGEAVLGQLFGAPLSNAGPAFEEMNEITTDYLFGELWSRPGLETRLRSLVTVSVLCAQGHERQLRAHLKGALNLDWTPDQLKEVMIHVAHYAGWPTGMNGLRVLQELVAERGLTFENAATPDASAD